MRGVRFGLTAKFDGIRREWCQFLDRYPLVVAPVLTEVAFPAGYDIAGPEEHRRVGRAMRMCAVTSLVGVPAVSIPTGLAEGVPVGVQLITPFYREDVGLAAAAEIERAVGHFTPVTPAGGESKSTP